MKKIKLLLLFLVMFSTMSIFSQEKTTVINDFVKAVFVENKSVQFIAEHYIYYEPITDPKVSSDERRNFIEMLLSKLRKEKSEIFDSSNFQIVNYNDFTGDKVKFLHEPQDTYIVISNNIPVVYLYLKENKIFSFNYILKGEDALFITY